MKRRCVFLFLGVLLAAVPAAWAVEANVRQLVVAIAPDWDAKQGRLWLFQRDEKGGWQHSGETFPVLFGRSGLAWGRGLLGADEPGRHKVERDGRAPAGTFRIGTVYTYDAALPGGSGYPHHQVTDADAWVDNPTSPDYNRHVVIPDPANPPPWFKKQKMRGNDFAYRWLVEIRHNADPPVPGAGSAIFCPIWRGETRPTSGCTTMAQENLVKLIRWLRAADRPEYVLLPRAEYNKKWRDWGLPDPALLATTP